MGSWKILPENEEGSEILERLMHIHRSDPDKYAYELLCMEDILHIWRNLLVLLHRSFPVPTDNDEFIREHRMRKMVSYIQSHFEQPLTIDDIAGASFGRHFVHQAHDLLQVDVLKRAAGVLVADAEPQVHPRF